MVCYFVFTDETNEPDKKNETNGKPIPISVQVILCRTEKS